MYKILTLMELPRDLHVILKSKHIMDLLDLANTHECIFLWRTLLRIRCKFYHYAVTYPFLFLILFYNFII